MPSKTPKDPDGEIGVPGRGRLPGFRRRGKTSPPPDPGAAASPDLYASPDSTASPDMHASPDSTASPDLYAIPDSSAGLAGGADPDPSGPAGTGSRRRPAMVAAGVLVICALALTGFLAAGANSGSHAQNTGSTKPATGHAVSSTNAPAAPAAAPPTSPSPSPSPSPSGGSPGSGHPEE